MGFPIGPALRPHGLVYIPVTVIAGLLVENVGVEPLFSIPNAACYALHYILYM